MAGQPKGFAHPNLQRVISEVEEALQQLGEETNEAPLNPLKRLSSIDPDQVRHRLRKSITSLAELDAEAVLGLTQMAGGGGNGKPDQRSWARLSDSARVPPIHASIVPRYHNPKYVRYLHLAERDWMYSVGIFVFPPGATIPLHDHPGMAVLSRILYGEASVRYFDLVNSSACGEDGKDHALHGPDAMSDRPQGGLLERGGSWILSIFSGNPPSSQSQGTARAIPEGSLRARTRVVKRLRAPDTAMLLPREGNVHEFTAGASGAAILDVLLPPYDADDDRDCTFYRAEMDAANESAHRPSGDDGFEGDCWLVPIDQPSDFECMSGEFKGIGSSNG